MWPASEGWGSFDTHRNNPDPRTEGYVAALFQALIDSSNENNDETTYSASSVATAFRSYSGTASNSVSKTDYGQTSTHSPSYIQSISQSTSSS